MTSSGLLTLRARLANGAVQDIAVELKRPPVARLFIGQNPEAVVKTVPYIYTLCAQAQRAAAQAAQAAALGEPRRAVDEAGLWIELLHENFWRLLLDWPVACGLPAEKNAFVAWRAERLGENRLVATRHLLDATLAGLAEKCREILVDRRPRPAKALPALAPEKWLAYWQGKTAEIPVPQPPLSIAAAYAGRLDEVKLAFAALESGAAFPVAQAGGDGWGIGQTNTARGVLTHAVHVGDGRVVNYRVWAPTDGYFADAGALAALLEGEPVTNSLSARQLIDRAVLALDPCLPYVVELNDA